MVIHEHPGVQADAKALWQLGEKFNKATTVPIIPKNRPAFIAPSHHMMSASDPLDS